MVQQIKECKELIPYLKDIIEDEGIKVGISEKIGCGSIAIIKVDEYYAGLHIATPPKAVDFLVTVDCECASFVMYLLEFKNVNSPKFLKMKDIHEKFENTIDDFLSARFGYIFLNDRYKYKNIFLYLVSDAYGLCGKYNNFNEYRDIMDKTSKRDTLKTEISLGTKLFRFRGKILRISFDIPPNPIIQKFL